MTPEQKLLQIVANARGDDLERAQAAFRGLSPEQMQFKHGHNDLTRSEILEAYEHERKLWQDANDLLHKLLENR